MNDRIIVSRL